MINIILFINISNSNSGISWILLLHVYSNTVVFNSVDPLESPVDLKKNYILFPTVFCSCLSFPEFTYTNLLPKLLQDALLWHLIQAFPLWQDPHSDLSLSLATKYSAYIIYLWPYVLLANT